MTKDMGLRYFHKKQKPNKLFGFCSTGDTPILLFLNRFCCNNETNVVLSLNKNNKKQHKPMICI